MVGSYFNSDRVAFCILALQAELALGWTAEGGCPYATLDGAESRPYTGIRNELHY
jgi:hypothetical protein